MTRLATTLALAALYLGVLGSAAPLDLACGLLLGGVLAFAFTKPGALGGPREVLRRFLYFPLFVVGVVREVARGFLGMARVLLGARDWRRQGFVEVDVGARTSVGVTVSALVAGFSPGSVVVGRDLEQGRFIVHVIDASDPERVRRDLQRFYERYQRAVFP